MSTAIGSMHVDLGLRSGAFDAGIRRARGGLKGFGTSALGIAGTFGAGLGIASTIGTLSTFETSMAQVAAISRASEQDLARMRDTAKEMGSTTEFSASQSADALKYLSLASLDAEEAIKALPQVLNLATAGGMDLASAADLATDAASSLGLGVEGLPRLMDVLANQAASSNTAVDQAGQALLKFGGIARVSGIEVEEAGAAIGVLGDNGLKGAEAGTAMRAMLVRLQAPAEAARKALKGAKLSLADVDIQARGLTPVMETLAAANLDTAQMAAIFGQEHLVAAGYLVRGTESLKDYTAANIAAEGSSDKMAATMRDSLGGDIKGLVSSVEGLVIAMGDAGLTAAIRGVLQVVTDGVRWVSGLNENLLLLAGAGGGLALTAVAAAPFVSMLGLMGIGIGNTGRMLGLMPRVAGPAATALDGLGGTVVTTSGKFGRFARLARFGGPILAVGLAALTIYENWDYLSERYPSLTSNIETAIDSLILKTGLLSEAMGESVEQTAKGVLSFGDFIEAKIRGDEKAAADFLASARFDLVKGPLGDHLFKIGDTEYGGGFIDALAGSAEPVPLTIIPQIDMQMLDVERQNIEHTMQAIQERMDQIGTGPMTATLMQPLQDQMRFLQLDLDDVDARIKQAETQIAASTAAIGLSFGGVSTAATSASMATLDTVDGLVVGVAAESESMRGAGLGIGLALGDGMIAGIGARQEQILEAARQTARGAEQAVRAELQIKSPSRVMHGLGVHVAEGFAGGIATGQQLVDAASTAMAGGVTGGLGSLDGVADTGLEMGGVFSDAESKFTSLVSSVLSGSQGMGDAIRSMLAEVGSELLTSGARGLFGSLVGSISGLGGGLFDISSWEGGGYTGSGPRSGGVDGRGGFHAVLHPNEVVSDLTRGSFPSLGEARKSGEGGSVHVTVGVSVDGNGNLMPFVQDIAERTTRAGVQQYDRAMPDRMKQINDDPRARR